jgi:hypothetical protein
MCLARKKYWHRSRANKRYEVLHEPDERITCGRHPRLVRSYLQADAGEAYQQTPVAPLANRGVDLSSLGLRRNVSPGAQPHRLNKGARLASARSGAVFFL